MEVALLSRLLFGRDKPDHITLIAKFAEQLQIAVPSHSALGQLEESFLLFSYTQ